MLGNKFLVTLIAMFALLAALFSGEISHFSEGFMPGTVYCKNKDADKGQFGPWAVNGVQINGVGHTAVKSGNAAICTANTKLGYQLSECGVSDFKQGVSSPRTIQPTISPRFNSGGMTPSIRFSPTNTPGAMAYNQTKPIDIQAAADLLKPASKQPAKTVEKYEYESAHVPLPKDMCNINIMGTESQPVIYDRLMYSNMRSRLRGQGDYIRGDLQIVPDNYKAGNQHNNWFQVSVKPERDLNPGAMEQLFGRSEELSLSVGQGDVCVPTYGL